MSASELYSASTWPEMFVTPASAEMEFVRATIEFEIDPSWSNWSSAVSSFVMMSTWSRI